MSKSKSPKKDAAPAVEADPEAREKARLAQFKRSKKKGGFLDKYSYHIVFGILGAMLIFALFNSFWKSGPNIHTTMVNDAAYIDDHNSAGRTF